MTETPEEITILLRRWREGDRDAESELFEALMPELRKIARRCFRGERPGHTIQPTALVNEAFLRLAAVKHIEWQHRKDFLAMAATMMRRYLIDHARGRPSVQLSPIEGMPERFLGRYSPIEQRIAIHTLLDELDAESHEKRMIVELKFSLGFTEEEIAEVMNLSLRDTQRQWHLARRWLFERLESSDGSHFAKQ
jgi:RNA polymerase sigma factor (TIGR02999 family)